MAAPPVRGWEAQILKGVGAPVTPNNIRYVQAWQRAEGGNATNNPFNTTLSHGRYSNYNSVGVKNYPDPGTGIQATVATLLDPRYAGIVHSLRSNADPRLTARALAASPWGTGGLVEKMLGGGALTPAPAVGRGVAGNTTLAPPPSLSMMNTTNEMLGLLPLNLPLPARTAPVGTGTPLAYGGVPALGKVTVAPGANRPGVPLDPGVIRFVQQIAGVSGQHLVIGTGSNHNQFVAGTQRESQHWTGHAADIPANGSALTQLGQNALIAAGANPTWARKQSGGVYNLGRYQIIFNSMVGGNHFNHLHVGVR